MPMNDMGDGTNSKRSGTRWPPSERHALRVDPVGERTKDDAAAIHEWLVELIGEQYRVESSTMHHGEIQLRLERFDDSDRRIRDCLADAGGDDDG